MIEFLQCLSNCLKEYVIRHDGMPELDEVLLDDIMAIVLNHLPAKYVSTRKGEMFAKTQLRAQLESDIFREITYAVKKVMTPKED